ncbi:MAG TPA: hypothetical protein VIC05_13670 [Solirubrobacteraceae bacterium]
MPAISLPNQLAPLLQRTVETAARSLGEAGCEAPVDEALTLVASALGVPPTELAHVTDIPPEAHREIDARMERHSQREPLEYICGWCRYRGLELAIDHRVLIPFEDTGPLVELALGLPRGSRVHDTGTGSGAIALAVKAERSDLVVSGSDISPPPLSPSPKRTLGAYGLTLHLRRTTGFRTVPSTSYWRTSPTRARAQRW